MPTNRARGTATAAAAALVSACLLSACGDGSGSGPDSATGRGSGEAKPSIVATTGIWADVVGNVACDAQAEVVALLPPGGDPHSYEPSMADRGRMESASLVVANGLGLEESLGDTLEAAEAGGVEVFRAGEHVEPIEVDSRPDPHIWQDPTRVMAALPALADALVNTAGLDREAVDACVRDYAAELAALDEEVRRMTSEIPSEDRILVTNHDSLGYFADRYGFEVMGTVIPQAGALAETNPADLESLAGSIEEAGVPAVFAESQHSDSDAQALADRVGDVEVVTLHTDSLGEEGSGADDYLALVRRNGELISEALRRDSGG